MKKLSNSLIRSVLTSECQYFIKLQMDGVKSDPTPAMTNGLIIEHQMIGSTMTGEEPHLPLLKNGALSKVEKDLRDRADYVKSLFPAMGIEILSVQDFIQNDEFAGHIDFLGKVKSKKAIVDIKFSGAKLYDNYFGWPYDLTEKLSEDEFQSVLYPYIMKDAEGEFLPFYYLLIGKTWIRFVKVEFGQDHLDYFLKVADDVRNRIDRMTFEPLKDYNACNSCILRSKCDKTTLVPGVEVVEL